ncbi:MAG: glycosyltransferase family 2 protein [Bacteroidota bacterium]|jgi:N-acetylglucosaminyl-diphospho-decaprenol L-rhamnosyltransferase|nr:glycosyltransferase family 2 protein [Bacteroidota bacterium]
MVDIVIINWNSNGYLQKCIHSILSSDNIHYVKMVYIIDNNSDDASVDHIQLNNKIEIIRNKENRGFAKGCNQGFKLCTAPYVLLLNPDTQLLNTTLEDCILFMGNETEIDILGCRLLNDNGKISPSCARFPTPVKLFMDSFGLPKVFPSIVKPAILMTEWDHKNSQYVNQVMGAFMFMRHSVFDKIGYFDERFFVYYEELDFSKRLFEFGGKSYFNTNISIIHSGEGTTKAVKGFRLFLNLHSRLQYARKHFSIAGYFLVWFCTFFIEPFSRTFLLLIRGEFKEISEIFKGYNLLIKSSKVMFEINKIESNK